MDKDLYLCDLLVHNIKFMRSGDEVMREKANISDGLCAIELAMNEVCTDRVNEMLYTLKESLLNYHFLIDLIAIDKPKI